MATKLFWIVQKDLVIEFRTRQTWLQMLLLGVLMAFLLSYQREIPQRQRQQMAASFCWLTICFVSISSLGQSINKEREDGCWEALQLYPIAPQALYFAKLAVNAVTLAALQAVVVLIFSLVFQTVWLEYPVRLFVVAVLGNLGITSVGTLLAATSSQANQGQSLLVLLLLPLLVPVILGASEATRLIGDSHVTNGWWSWIRLLVAFATIYMTAGWMLFEFVMEE